MDLESGRDRTDRSRRRWRRRRLDIGKRLAVGGRLYGGGRHKGGRWQMQTGRRIATGKRIAWLASACGLALVQLRQAIAVRQDGGQLADGFLVLFGEQTEVGLELPDVLARREDIRR